jgi:Holliday junction DNA helicase RuvA
VIVFIHGEVRVVGKGYADVDVAGVGYRVFVPEPTARRLAPGERVFLYTYRHVREDTDELYGFLAEADRDWFQLLLGVSGIGPKGALQVLSETSRDEFARAIAEEDVAALCRLPGIGKKTAQRLILELRDKLSTWLPPGSATSAVGSQQFSHARAAIQREAGLAEELVEALMGLGYNERQASEAVAAALEEGDGLDVAEALRRCLRWLDSGR